MDFHGLWNAKALEEIKQYIMRMPTLGQPTSDRPLVLYFTIREKALSLVRISEDEIGHQWPVYYVSKSLHGAEINYAMLEKVVYGLIH